MRKVLLGLLIAGFVVVLFITLRPILANLRLNTETVSSSSPDERIELEPSPYFTVVQGGTETALYVTNNLSEAASFSLGHEHAYLSFRPQGDRLNPGATREILVHADPACPVGEIELPVYLRADIDGNRLSNDTVILLNVVPGELSVAQDQYGLNVLWNEETAPRGAVVYYRVPGESEWQVWGTTPNISPPRHLEPGDYSFEFKAELGEAESAVETFDINIPEVVVAEEPEPEPKKSVSSSSSAKEEPEPEPKREPIAPPEPGTRQYNFYLQYRLPGESPEQFADRLTKLRDESEDNKDNGETFKWFEMPADDSGPGWY